MKYLNVKNCKALANSNGKQLSKDALFALNNIVHETIDKACRVHNGSKARIDSTVINFVKGAK